MALEERAKQLHFADYFSPTKFVTQFDRIIEDFKDLGTTYDNDYLVAKFLSCIDDKNKVGHPYAIFVNTIEQAEPEVQTIEHVKRKFFEVDNSSFRKMYNENREQEKKKHSDALHSPTPS